MSAFFHSGLGQVRNQFGRTRTFKMAANLKENGACHFFQNAVTPEIMVGIAPYLGHRGTLGAPSIFCRPDVVGSLDSRASRSNSLFCFHGSAPIVIRPKRYISFQKFKMPEFKNTASLNGL